jgi:hypothetical protein
MRSSAGAPPGTAVKARPLTQQGLSGAIRVGTASGRQVQDGHYFFGKLSQKMSQISNVNNGLRQQIEELDGSRAQVAVVSDRLGEVAAEVQELEGQLSGYNLVIQKAAVSASTSNIVASADSKMVRALHIWVRLTVGQCASSMTGMLETFPAG